MDTVTLVLSGDVPVEQFSSAVSGLASLLRELTNTVSSQEPIRWTVDQLEAGSATIAVRGHARDEAAVDRVVHAYENVARALAAGERVPFTRAVSVAARQIVEVINGSIESVTFETPERDFIVAAPLPAPVEPRELGVPVAYGAVQGRLQTLSSRGRLRFTLYDLLHDRAVSCYVTSGEEDLVRDRWGRLVAVEGHVSRDPITGRPLAIRRIRSIEQLPEGDSQGYRRARGVLRGKPSLMSADEAIRRVRDA